MGGNFKFQVQDSFWNNFFGRLGDLKNESHFLKKKKTFSLVCKAKTFGMILHFAF